MVAYDHFADARREQLSNSIQINQEYFYCIEAY